MMDGFGEHGWGMGWWWIIGIILLIIIIWAFARGFNRNNSATNDSEKSALNILKERYARGEIDKLEFEERKKGL